MTALPIATPYPLCWPQGFPRCFTREQGQFRSDYDAALKNVRKSLQLFAKDSGRNIESPVLSSNMNPLIEGDVVDPGVAVWFVWDGHSVCIAVDRYTQPAANLQAIHHIIEARRVELRHGTLNLVRATMVGFKFLPAPSGRHWRDVLGISDARPTRSKIEDAFRERSKRAHPDAGGSDAQMSALVSAKQMALKEIGE